MRFEDVRSVVGDTPHTTPERGRQLYDFVLERGLTDVLELGFAHGVATCYVAAALDELGAGTIVSIDNRSALERNPSATELLKEAGLEGYAQPIFADTSYNWELLRLIEQRSTDGRAQPLFDLCFLDGAHTWETDGFAFFLVDKLLRPGGWLLFDDLDWSYAASPSMRELDWVLALPEDQRTTPQVARVFELLVGQHPDYTDLRVDGGWGWARKRLLAAGGLVP